MDANDAMARMTGADPRHIVGATVEDTGNAATRRITQLARRALTTGTTQNDVRLDDVATLQCSPLTDSSGTLLGIAVMALPENSELTAAAGAPDPNDPTPLLDPQLRDLLHDGIAGAAVVTLDAEGVVTNWDLGGAAVFGHPADQAVGRHVSFLWPPQTVPAERTDRQLAAAAANGSTRAEGWRLRADGSQFLAATEITAVRSAGTTTGRPQRFVMVCRDITAQRRLERALRRQALHDGLTDLPNRTLLRDRLAQAIRQAQRAQTPVALLVVDLAGFRALNDTHGHSVGDLVLQEVAARLTTVLRDQDTVARVGNDEFAILLPQLRSHNDAELVGRKALEALARPLVVGTTTIALDGRVAVTVFPDHGVTVDELLHASDAAAARARRSSVGMVTAKPAAATPAATPTTLAEELSAAIRHGELGVAYQPVVDLTTNAIIAVEALARWTHPRMGELAPATFLPVAEQAGLLRALTRSVLTTATTQLRQWHADGIGVRLAVNLAQSSLADAELVSTVMNLLARNAVDPGSLTFDLPEAVVLADPTVTAPVVDPLARVGVRFSIDDFGTGYSSVARLRELPIDEVKIDRSLIDRLPGTPEDRQIVSALLDIGRHLNLRVVAEGVATPATAQLLRKIGCRHAQGFALGLPVPAAQLTPALALSAREGKPVSA